MVAIHIVKKLAKACRVVPIDFTVQFYILSPSCYVSVHSKELVVLVTSKPIGFPNTSALLLKASANLLAFSLHYIIIFPL